MRQPMFAQFPGIGIGARNLLEARMIVTPYNQHVRLLSSEPFGWFAPPKFARGLGVDIVMESFHSSRLCRAKDSSGVKTCNRLIATVACGRGCDSNQCSLCGSKYVNPTNTS